MVHPTEVAFKYLLATEKILGQFSSEDICAMGNIKTIDTCNAFSNWKHLSKFFAVRPHIPCKKRLGLFMKQEVQSKGWGASLGSKSIAMRQMDAKIVVIHKHANTVQPHRYLIWCLMYYTNSKYKVNQLVTNSDPILQCKSLSKSQKELLMLYICNNFKSIVRSANHSQMCCRRYLVIEVQERRLQISRKFPPTGACNCY